MVIDKEDAQSRKGIFMIDASRGFMKDGPKNRLRSMDIHKIVDVFNKRLDVPKYARMVSFSEIEQNEFNLNLPRYIDSQTPEDRQDIAGHLQGGIPAADVDFLERYWAFFPELRHDLFKENRPSYLDLSVEKSTIKTAIHEHHEFVSFIADMNAHFAGWRNTNAATLKELQAGCNPRKIISQLSKGMLAHYADKPLIDPYDVYQHLMDFWSQTMQDDCYLIASEGWKAETYRVIETDKKEKEKDKGWVCELVPKPLIVARYFSEEQAAINRLAGELDNVTARLSEMVDEHGGEDGVLNDVSTKSETQAARTQSIVALWNSADKSACADYLALTELAKEYTACLRDLSAHDHLTPLKNTKGKLTLKDVKGRLATLSEGEEYETLAAYIDTDKVQKDAAKQAKKQLAQVETTFVVRLDEDPLPQDLCDLKALARYLELIEREAALKKAVKEAETALDDQAYAKYPTLTESEIKTLVVDEKWLASLDAAIHSEMDRVSQQLTRRVKELAERYEDPLPRMLDRIAEIEAKVNGHLKTMGFAWQ